ncbi:Glycine--tRNA ligase 1, mitochondrial [Neolecta irregularis DAH-3]|uniref:Glycine--tRNA ligase 1, mitochondrial n=1 Tax=Neolecta irregularis (strain DAH-3) TaxID=1198029 RepID=A0A1U7LLH3_NEOID|nr:Glycine--tRNA ligase 1, mitochondrial [Neolecta irregularis DAH-3]|eukprot:OLL23504.1 Glycine--tRNA ligase 1, mitochondrial [Neolecta irregularis DAH-3]
MQPCQGQTLEAPQEFNLMLDTSSGLTGEIKGYIRPETVKGQFSTGLTGAIKGYIRPETARDSRLPVLRLEYLSGMRSALEVD